VRDAGDVGMTFAHLDEVRRTSRSTTRRAGSHRVRCFALRPASFPASTTSRRSSTSWCSSLLRRARQATSGSEPGGRLVRVVPFGRVMTRVASGNSFACMRSSLWSIRWCRRQRRTRLSRLVGPPRLHHQT